MYRHWNFDTITINKVNISGKGTVTVSKFGKVRILVDFPSLIPSINEPIDVYGTNYNGERFEAKNAVVTKSKNATYTTLEICILKLRLWGDGVTEENISWDIKKLHLKNFKSYCSRSKYKIKKLHAMIIDDSNAASPNNADKGEHNQILVLKSDTAINDSSNEFFYELRNLLSIAQRNHVFPTIIESYLGDKFIYADFVEKDLNTFCGKPLTGWFGDDILNFLSVTISSYESNETNFGLSTICEYYWRMHTETTFEIKFLFASVLMEALKFNWAANVSNLEKAMKSNGLIRGFRDKGGPQTGKLKYKNKSFEDLMIMLSTHLGYTANKGTFTFIDDRNALFHSGLSSSAQISGQNQWSGSKSELKILINQIDDLILRILNYSGDIYDYENPNNKIMFPSRT